MILKLSIFGLVLVLIAVIAISHYVNKERFEDVHQPATIADLEILLKEMKAAVPNLQARTPDAATTKRINDLKVAIELIPDLIISVKSGALPPTAISHFDKNAIDYSMTILTDPTVPLPNLDKPHSPVNNKMTQPSVPSVPSVPSMPKLSDAMLSSADSSHNQTNHSAAAPIRNDVQPQVSVSDTSYQAMALKQKSDLLSGIQKIVHNELLSNRATQPVPTNRATQPVSTHYDDSCDNESNCNVQSDCNAQSDCTAQGKEFNKIQSKPKGCPSQPSESTKSSKGSSPAPYQSSLPDMSKYIKKDSIPCWGCALDY